MYLRITDADFEVKQHIEAKPGVYKLIALDETNHPLHINRFLGTDPNGILYIGQSENLRKRLTNMRRAFLPQYKSVKHIAVRRYNELSKVAKWPSIQSLVVLVELTTEINPIAKDLEERLLKEYEAIYGERPPMNKQ